jgi:hypothetical protein
MLLASSVAPLTAAVPIVMLGFFMWSYAINGPLIMSEMSAVTPFSFAVLSSVPIYGCLAVGLLVVSFLLQVFERLTLKALLVVSAAISLTSGVAVGSGAFAYAAAWEAVLNVLLVSLVSFALLAGVSASWWRLAARRNLRTSQQ